MAYQYFLLPAGAFQALVGSEALAGMTVLTPAAPGQPALIITDRPWAVPAEAQPLISAPGTLRAPSVFQPDTPQEIRTLAAQVAVEFTALVDETQNRPEPTAPDQAREAIESWLLGRHFAQNEPIGKIIVEAQMIRATLHEIRRLRGAEHFAVDLVDEISHHLSYIGADYGDFARLLFGELLTYTLRRDAAEKHFLKPYFQALQELQELLDRTLTWRFATPFISGRIKQGVLRKMLTRDWQDMSEFYDLAGLRMVLANQREVEEAVHYFQEELGKAHFEHGEGSAPYSYQPQGFDRKDYDSGYRAVHVDLRKVFKNGESFPVAEVQFITVGIHRWGEIQRNLVYKSGRIPPMVRNALNGFCRRAAHYIVACEERSILPDYPVFNDDSLETIADLRRRAYYRHEVHRMEMLLGEFAVQAGASETGA